MKKVTLVLFVSLISISVANATLIDANQPWMTTLDAHQSITCITHYIPDIAGVTDTLIFTAAPQFIDDLAYHGDETTWQTAISNDNKMVYLWGPQSTNPASFTQNWFLYDLEFQWDDQNLGDPDHPVYVDTAVFNGSQSTDEWGWKGTPGNENSWIATDNSHRQQNDPQSEPYTNPIPEPITLGLLTLGLILSTRIKKR